MDKQKTELIKIVGGDQEKMKLSPKITECSPKGINQSQMNTFFNDLNNLDLDDSEDQQYALKRLSNLQLLTKPTTKIGKEAPDFNKRSVIEDLLSIITLAIDEIGGTELGALKPRTSKHLYNKDKFISEYLIIAPLEFIDRQIGTNLKVKFLSECNTSGLTGVAQNGKTGLLAFKESLRGLVIFLETDYD